MPPRTNQSLGASLSSAIGAIATTKAGVAKAAADVYSPLQDQTSHPGPVSGPVTGSSS